MAKRDKVAERLEEVLETLDDHRECLSPERFKAWCHYQYAEPAEWKPEERAAKYFGLDPADPTDSKVLLRLLAYVVFPKPKKQGRKKGGNKWNVERFVTLGSRLHDLETKARRRFSDSAAAKELLKLYPEYGSNRQWLTLRQWLPEARERFALRQQLHKGVWPPMDPPTMDEEVMTGEGWEHFFRQVRYLTEEIEAKKQTRVGRRRLRLDRNLRAFLARLREIEANFEKNQAEIKKAKKAQKKAEMNSTPLPALQN
jgi:hypothetical protein